MSETTSWNISSILNSELPPDGFPEGMNYRNVNNSARELMAALSRRSKDLYGTLISADGSQSNRIVLTPNTPHLMNQEGERFVFKAHKNLESGTALKIGEANYANMVDFVGNPIVLNTVPENHIIEVVYKSAWVMIGTRNWVAVESRIETGTIMPYAGTVIPTGLLLCDGSAVSRATYSNLFAVIGTTHGSGDGSTTFNVPDLRGRTMMGSGGATTFVGNVVGTYGGDRYVTLESDKMPTHRHHYVATAHTHLNYNMAEFEQPHNHSFSLQEPGSTLGASGGTNNQLYLGQPRDHITGDATTTGGSHNHTGETSQETATVADAPTGGGMSHSNLQPSIVLNYVIQP